ncbi:MAG: PAS domain-containing protein [Caldilineaceae bacterium]|nr:PAS domain-containing protein [Caldilineaceae bacterium]
MRIALPKRLAPAWWRGVAGEYNRLWTEWTAGKVINRLAFPKIRWRTALLYTITIFLLMLGLSLFLTLRINQWYLAQRDERVIQQTVRLAQDPSLHEAWTQGAPGLQRRLQLWLSIDAVHLTAIAPDGVVLADSHTTLASVEQVEKTAEIADALAGAVGQSRGYDAVLEGQALIIVVPVKQNEQLLGLLRIAYPVLASQASFTQLQATILPAMILMAFVMSGLLIFQAERTDNTLRRLTQAAERITKGDLGARTLSLSGGAIGQFVRAFNRMAEKLQTQMAKRAREKDRLHTVLQVMTDGVLIVNRHGRVRLINPAAAQILKISPERALKRSFVQAVRDHRIVEVFVRCQQSGRNETALLELDRERFMRMIVTPFLRGDARGYLVVIQDLTRLHQLQTVRQDFISNISHELRTPIASLRALVETLSDGALDDPVAAQRFLRHMEVEVDALSQMVQELLDLARIESGKASLQIAKIPALDLLRHGIERLLAQATRAQVTLQLDVTTELPVVYVDAGRVEQVLTNLIHNAIKFTPPGGAIQVSATINEEGALLVKVTDTGVGIAQEDLPRIFERFYKADRARSGGGTGLGLAIAKHITQAHGGRIWVESRISKGSTFFFTLPQRTEAIALLPE